MTRCSRRLHIHLFTCSSSCRGTKTSLTFNRSALSSDLGVNLLRQRLLVTCMWLLPCCFSSPLLIPTFHRVSCNARWDIGGPRLVRGAKNPYCSQLIELFRAPRVLAGTGLEWSLPAFEGRSHELLNTHRLHRSRSSFSGKEGLICMPWIQDRSGGWTISPMDSSD